MTHPNIVPTQDDRQPAICEHGIRSPWACHECDEAALARHRQTRPVGEDEVERLYNLVRPIWHYAPPRTSDGALFDASERGVMLRKSIAAIAALTPSRTYEPDLSLSAETHEKIAEIERGGATQQRGFIVGATAARTYKQGIEDALENWWANYPLTEADTAGSCRSPELCFQYNEWVRCGPCGIKHRDAIRALGTKDPKGPI